MNIFYLIFIGIFIGMANIIPGVSGGTIAVVFNIYDKFVNAININLKELKKNWKFLVPLLAGMALGILIFSKLIQILYNHFPIQTNYFFTGLIIGSVPMLFNYMIGKENKTKEQKETKFSVKTIISCIIGIILGVSLIILFSILEKKFGGEVSKDFVLPDWTFPLAIKIFVAGIIGAVAMIVPGISGSLLMLIMGVYPIIITAIPTLVLNPTLFFKALFLLLPNGIGVLLGLLLGAKLISWLLKRFKTITYAVILGLLIGSAIILCPIDSVITSFSQKIACICCIVFGYAMAYISSKVTSPSEEKSKEVQIEQTN